MHRVPVTLQGDGSGDLDLRFHGWQRRSADVGFVDGGHRSHSLHPCIPSSVPTSTSPEIGTRPSWKSSISASEASVAPKKSASCRKKPCFGRKNVRFPSETRFYGEKRLFQRARRLFSLEKSFSKRNRLHFSQKRHFPRKNTALLAKKCTSRLGKSVFRQKNGLLSRDDSVGREVIAKQMLPQAEE